MRSEKAWAVVILKGNDTFAPGDCHGNSGFIVCRRFLWCANGWVHTPAKREPVATFF